MARIITALFSVVALILSTNAVSAGTDFFSNNVIGSDVMSDSTVDRIENVRINGYVYRSDALNTKLMETRYFFSKVKRDAISKLQDGSISRYAAEDIANSLEYVAHSMNAYFANMKSYERTGRNDYKKLALQNLKDANMHYDQLKAATWRSVRQ
jgi:hypothetical protein